MQANKINRKSFSNKPCNNKPLKKQNQLSNNQVNHNNCLLKKRNLWGKKLRKAFLECLKKSRNQLLQEKKKFNYLLKFVIKKGW